MDVLAAAAPAERARIEAVVSRRMAGARAAWPEVVVDGAAFGAHLVACIQQGAPSLADALDAMCVEDLYLAFACGEGNAHALSAFHQTFATEFAAVANQVRAAQVSGDDLTQTLAARLFTQPTPKIREYTGHGKLRNWVRVAAVRLCVDTARKQSGRERPLASDRVPEVVDWSHDPELRFLKREHHEHLRVAFEDAAAALSAEDRNLLRHHYTQGMNIDELAATRGVHRATAARQLARARERLLSETRRRLMLRLRISEQDMDSVLRAAESALHITLDRVFRSVP